MKKKQYIIPLVEFESLNAFEMMKINDGGSPGLPGGPGEAPARKPGKLDGNAPVF